MKNHGNTVARELDVELPCVGARFPRQHGRVERILGRVERIPSMGKDHGPSPQRWEPVKKQALHGLPST